MKRVTMPKPRGHAAKFLGRHSRFGASLAALGVLSGCASMPQLQARTAPAEPRPYTAASSQTGASAASRTSAIEILNAQRGNSPAAPAAAYVSATAAEIEALLEPRDVDVALPPQPLPQFIDTVFGQILRVPYSTGPGVAQRRDMIALRGPTVLPNRRYFSMAQMALAQYGLAVVIENGHVRIVQDSVLSGQSPAFIRTRTLPEAPVSSRPVMQFFSVSALSVESLVSMLDQAYPNRGSVSFSAQPNSNMLLISGGARDVASAASVVSQLDQPHFAGGQIARVEPVFMSAEQLADSLTRTLGAEGYRTGNPVEQRRGALTILPLQQANQVLVFANDPALFERALYWVGQIDRVSALGDAEGVFVYTARHTNVEELGALAQASASGAGGAPAQMPPEQAVRRVNGVRAGGPPTATPATPTSSGGLTIDTSGNRILFRGTPSAYAHLLALLEQLDTPPRQVLIEITIAEVTLTDETRFGVEWFLNQTTGNGTIRADTRGGSSPGDGGLAVLATNVFGRGTVQASLDAFASNNNLNILSTPRLVTRSGSAAEFQVGTDVPVVTSQRASDNQTGGDTDILQTVQYRQTGVILNVRPVVYGDDRIDIEIYQEVSSQQPNTNSAIASPLILNRSVATQISLQEGMTAVIGGMIQDNYSRNQRGVPLLKDIPFVGAAFRSEEITGDKVELVILVTPYIIRDSEDMSAFADSMSNSVNRTLRRRGPQVYTLYPWRVPFTQARDHALPDARAPRPSPPAASPSSAPAPRSSPEATPTSANGPDL